MAEIPVRVRCSGLCAVHCPGHPGMPSAGILAAAGVSREWCGQWVRREWDAWARQQPDVAEHPSWTVPWAALDERDREADRAIGEALFCAGWRAA